MIIQNADARTDNTNALITEDGRQTERKRVSEPGHFRAPLVRTYVAGVVGEEPVTAFDVFDTVLPFVVFGLVKIFNDFSVR